MHHDDDKLNECFRKYKSPEKSYEDHSLFLRGSKRYAFLFDLEPTDYKGWAHGLKKAGYATNPKYPEMLIKLIEENKLYQYDSGVEIEVQSPTKGIADLADTDNFTIDIFKQKKVFLRNNRKYIIVGEGDSFKSLSKEFDLLPWQIFRYNDLPRNAKIAVGMELFIEHKRFRADRNHKVHVAEAGETMHQISQMYGVRLNSLYRKNGMRKGEEPTEGQVIQLRNRKR
jgi:hypothetical protein